MNRYFCSKKQFNFLLNIKIFIFAFNQENGLVVSLNFINYLLKVNSNKIKINVKRYLLLVRSRSHAKSLVAFRDFIIKKNSSTNYLITFHLQTRE